MEAATESRDLATTTKQVLPNFNLTPRNLEEALKLAGMMATSDLVPKDYRDKPGNVLIAVQMGLEIGLAPMQAIQNIAVINGKPGLYGDAGKALLLNAGCLIEEADIEEIRKTGVARCTIGRPGRSTVTRTFSVEDAKQAKLWGKEGPWTTYPHRQLAWRAFWYAARDGASDILKGLGGREELADIPGELRDITPEAERPRPVRASAVETSATRLEEPKPAPEAAPDPKAAKTTSPAPNGKLDFKILNRIFELMPRYNRKVNEDGAAVAVMRELYNVDAPSRLSAEQATEFVGKLEAMLAT